MDVECLSECWCYSGIAGTGYVCAYGVGEQLLAARTAGSKARCTVPDSSRPAGGSVAGVPMRGTQQVNNRTRREGEKVVG